MMYFLLNKKPPPWNITNTGKESPSFVGEYMSIAKSKPLGEAQMTFFDKEYFSLLLILLSKAYNFEIKYILGIKNYVKNPALAGFFVYLISTRFIYCLINISNNVFNILNSDR